MLMNKALVHALRNAGRYGDTDVVHVNETEKAMLRAMGGSGTTNPDTGLTEYAFLGDFGRALGMKKWYRMLNPLTATVDATGSPFSQKVLPVAAGIVGGIYGGPVGAAAASAAGSAATNAAAGKSGNQIGRSALISGIGGLVGGSLSGVGNAFTGASSGAGNAAGTAAGTAAGETAGQATAQGLSQSAAQIGSQLGGNTTGISLAQGAETLGSQGLAQGFTETAAKEAAAEATRQAIYRKLLVTALKQGGKELTRKQEIPTWAPPDMPQATPVNVRQRDFLSGPGSQYNKLVYGY